jgi:preprotein translocase subunit SecE
VVSDAYDSPGDAVSLIEAEVERTMEAKGVVTASDRSWKYLREVRAELKKVVWPTPRQTASYTGFVVVFSLVIVAIISLLDTIFNLGLHYYLH